MELLQSVITIVRKINLQNQDLKIEFPSFYTLGEEIYNSWLVRKGYYMSHTKHGKTCVIPQQTVLLFPTFQLYTIGFPG